MSRVTPRATARPDAADKVRGHARYTDDVAIPGLCHVALVRSSLPHGWITGIDVDAALDQPGVVAVVTGADLPAVTYGRGVRDIPVLARDKVRYLGEGIAAVVATSRREAEHATSFVEVGYEPLPAVTDPEAALADDAPAVHDAPWDYPRPAVTEQEGRNRQSRMAHGAPLADVETALAASEHVHDAIYTTPTAHQGYLEPQSCIAWEDDDGRVQLWSSDKAPYKLREEVANGLGVEVDHVVVNPVAIGGDFGGKGSYGGALLCALLARRTSRPVKLTLRYGEDLTTTNPRHPARIRVRIGCDAHGTLTAVHVDALLDGGAYAGLKPRAHADLHGIEEAASSYRVPVLRCDATIAYTTSVPRGHMRAPGSPQTVFAVESALDELAADAGLAPVELRRRNLLRDGERNPHGVTWAQARGIATLDAALAAVAATPAPVPVEVAGPDGPWRRGTGVALYDRATTGRSHTSLALSPTTDGGVRVEVPMPETGGGVLGAVREHLADGLGLPIDRVEVVQVATSALPYDAGVGGSRVTVSLSRAMPRVVEAWMSRASPDESVVVELKLAQKPAVTSFCVQVAEVAVDPTTGRIVVLRLTTAADVARIVNPAAHQMQLDGGAAMGYGFGRLEDLQVVDGQVWAANLGEFKLPSTRDVPTLQTVLVEGGVGEGALGVKAVGELANVPTAAAIANAVAAATGVRVRDLPVTAEKVWRALRDM